MGLIMALCYKLIRPPDKSAYWILIFLIAQPKHMFKLTDKEINAILGVLTILIRTYV